MFLAQLTTTPCPRLDEILITHAAVGFVICHVHSVGKRNSRCIKFQQQALVSRQRMCRSALGKDLCGGQRCTTVTLVARRE